MALVGVVCVGGMGFEKQLYIDVSQSGAMHLRLCACGQALYMGYANA